MNKVTSKPVTYENNPLHQNLIFLNSIILSNTTYNFLNLIEYILNLYIINISCLHYDAHDLILFENDLISDL